MKKVIAIILLGALLIGLCACSGAEDNMEKSLQGEWIMKAYPNNPIYMFMRFNGKNVTYGANLFGQDLENGTWYCTYAINGTSLELTTADGTVFTFRIQKNGESIRIFNDEGNEFIRKN